MKFEWVQQAAEIVALSSEQPADRVLGKIFRERKALAADAKRFIAAAVFAFFRWKEWLDPDAILDKKIVEAFKKQQNFDKGSFVPTDEELLRLTVPGWVFAEVDRRLPWLSTIQKTPVLWLRARRGEGALLAKSLQDCQRPFRQFLPDALVYEGSEDLYQVNDFKQGRMEIQDIASQAVGVVCDPKPGQTWWDACAGEGGKTMHLADLMENKGLIWASDPKDWRLKILKKRAQRAQIFNYRAVLWQDLSKPPTKTMFDGILVDAPCSGIGTWQRDPHARWSTAPKDVEELGLLQFKLLDLAVGRLKVGGRLVYSVCTLARQETTAVVEKFQAAHPEMEPDFVKNPFNPEESKSQFLWWPDEVQGNGMFVAVWKRREPEGVGPEHGL